MATNTQKKLKEKDQEGTVKNLQNVFQKEKKQEDKDEKFTMDITDIGNRFTRHLWMRKRKAFNRHHYKTV